MLTHTLSRMSAHASQLCSFSHAVVITLVPHEQPGCGSSGAACETETGNEVNGGGWHSMHLAFCEHS